MKLKSFNSFVNESVKTTVYIANQLAQDVLDSNTNLLESFDESDGFYKVETPDEIVKILEENGFSSPGDFTVLNEKLEVKYIGHESTPSGVEISIDVNGHKYGYQQKEGDIAIADVARKFEKMLQFSAGRALTWLKKHTKLSSGSASTEKTDLKKAEEETENN